MSVYNFHDPDPQGGNASGGCATACGGLFVLVFLVWPLLQKFTGVYDPPVSWLFPFLLGVPAFILAHILAIIALFSRAQQTVRWGKRALWITWGSIALFLVAGLVGYAIDLVRGKV